ncbi:unnamed protein product [Closterium sp. Naga37s-1]|nr:unnamed protein product [Closterium sp. Naga37s-1]
MVVDATASCARDGGEQRRDSGERWRAVESGGRGGSVQRHAIGPCPSFPFPHSFYPFPPVLPSFPLSQPTAPPCSHPSPCPHSFTPPHSRTPLVRRYLGFLPFPAGSKGATVASNSLSLSLHHQSSSPPLPPSLLSPITIQTFPPSPSLLPSVSVPPSPTIHPLPYPCPFKASPDS